MYFKYILEQISDSLLNKVLNLQLEQPKKGDWASTCIKNLSELNINKSLEEIRQMSKNNFKNLLKTKVRNNAFQYLIDKQRSKGSEIEYSELKMADYLLPYNRSISIDQKRQIFPSERS